MVFIPLTMLWSVINPSYLLLLNLTVMVFLAQVTYSLSSGALLAQGPLGSQAQLYGTQAYILLHDTVRPQMVALTSKHCGLMA